MSSQNGPYFSLEVAGIVEETPDARSVILRVPDDLKETFAYRPGQFLTFGVHVDDHQWVRCYSLASSPDTDSAHKVTVKRVEGGRISNWFNDAVSVGQSLSVMKPAGHFCLQDRQTPIVLFSGGSGITPVISLIKSALAKSERELRLVYANRDAASIIFRDELDALVARHPGRLRVSHRLDDVDGFLDGPAARAVVAEQRDADFYICGPGPFMDVVEAALSEESVAAEQIFIERFEIAETEIADAGAKAAGSGEAVEIYLDGEVHSVSVDEGETILAACHRAGVDAPCACTEGYCGACMALVKKGDVEMLVNDGGLDDSQIEAGWVLTCQSRMRAPGGRIEYPDAD